MFVVNVSSSFIFHSFIHHLMSLLKLHNPHLTYQSNGDIRNPTIIQHLFVKALLVTCHLAYIMAYMYNNVGHAQGPF